MQAVQWDGTRRPLIGRAVVSSGEPLENWLVRTNGVYSLHEAARAGHEETLRARLSGPQVRHNQYGWIVKSDEETDRAAVNAANEEGNTPLHLAAAACQTGAMKLLLEAGADKNARNKAGKRPAEVLGEAVRHLLE